MPYSIFYIPLGGRIDCEGSTQFLQLRSGYSSMNNISAYQEPSTLGGITSGHRYAADRILNTCVPCTRRGRTPRYAVTLSGFTFLPSLFLFSHAKDTPSEKQAQGAALVRLGVGGVVEMVFTALITPERGLISHIYT